MKTLAVLVTLVAVTLAQTVVVSIPPTNAEIAEQWSNFKVKFGKNYSSETEETLRKAIFKESVYNVKRHNANYERGDATFYVAINQFSDMLPYEAVEQMSGFLPELKKPSLTVHKASPAHVTNLTFHQNIKKIDWRSHGYVTPVKKQGGCSASWAFSATGAIEGQLYVKTGKLVSLSEQMLIDCTTTYGNRGCNGGTIDSAFQYVQNIGGINSEANYPYQGKDGSTCNYEAANSVGAVTGFVDVTPTEYDLQDALTDVGPVSVAVDASNWSFMHYAGGVYYEPDCSSTDVTHAMLAVGYGVTFQKGEYWILKNSWGSTWGDAGYIKMARNRDNHCGIATMASYPVV